MENRCDATAWLLAFLLGFTLCIAVDLTLRLL